jgi:putative sporulation protein YyaC
MSKEVFMLHHCHYIDKRAAAYLTDALTKHYFKHPHPAAEIVIICIGSVKLQGDSLGPIIGSCLSKQFSKRESIHIYGTVDKPVHALNLLKTMNYSSKAHPNGYVIAVDGCLGQFYKIGTLQLVEAPLEPGAGIGKQLPSVGHIHLKGVVNHYGSLGQIVLENASLPLIEEMAKVMSHVIIQACQQLVPQLAAKELPAERETSSLSS